MDLLTSDPGTSTRGVHLNRAASFISNTASSPGARKSIVLTPASLNSADIRATSSLPGA